MNIYEFITPSDPITFKADDDKVAFTCALLLGNGKAGCTNLKTGDSIPTMLMFAKDPDKDIQEFIGGDFKEFLEANKPKIAECFKSFSYGSASDRETFDDACDAITDPEKLKEFKAKHEDKTVHLCRNGLRELGSMVNVCRSLAGNVCYAFVPYL
jgi:hypothetical protein